MHFTKNNGSYHGLLSARSININLCNILSIYFSLPPFMLEGEGGRIFLGEGKRTEKGKEREEKQYMVLAGREGKKVKKIG